jgi:sporulation protein YlmC with PRC-barrel domain
MCISTRITAVVNEKSPARFLTNHEFVLNKPRSVSSVLNMKTPFIFGAILGVLGCAIAPLNAQTQTSTTTSGYVESSKIIGTTVKSSSGEDIGTIKDIVLDRNTGCMAYTVLSTGGTAARVTGSAKTVAVPWNVYSYDPGSRVVTTRIEKERIYSAPAFDYARVQEYSSPTYINQVYSYYGVSPSVGVGISTNTTTGTTTTGTTTTGTNVGAAASTGATASPAASASATVAASPSATVSASPSASASVSASPTASASASASASPASSRRGAREGARGRHDASGTPGASDETGATSSPSGKHRHGSATSESATSASSPSESDSATSDSGASKKAKKHKASTEEGASSSASPEGTPQE